MKIIRDTSGNSYNVLPPQDEQDGVTYAYHNYLIFEGGYIFNSLTGEIASEVDLEKDKHELISRWFMTPEDLDFSGLLYLQRQGQIQRTYQPYVNRYTIFTTMRCNAGCSYCFQHGGSDETLTDEVARDIALYIQNHATSREAVEIGWFGGEPLVNKEAISLISTYLRNRNYVLRSSISSNGDLFPEVTDAEIYLWNLKKAQFTIDAPGEEYDKIKGLPTGAYDRLRQTVGRLSTLGVRAQIRVHYHPEKGLDVAKQIVDDFKVFPNVFMYPAMIYDDPKCQADYENLSRLEAYMIESKVLNYNPMNQRRAVNCMADDYGIRCIRVDGSLTCCEHFSEGEQYGTIYSDAYDPSMLLKWKAKRKFVKKCYDCPLFPICEIIDKCPSTGICDEGYQYFKIDQIRRALKQLGGSNEQRKTY